MAGHGNTGMVILQPCGTRVIKAPSPVSMFYDSKYLHNEYRREIAVYKHLPQGHPRLVRMLDYEDDGGSNVSITLEYMPNNSIQRYLVGGCNDTKPSDEELARGRAVPRWRRASWALEATDGVMMLHAHGVIHADLKPENMLLDQDLHVRIIDLPGCALHDLPPLSLESAPFAMPRTPANSNGTMGCSVTTDLFALGSSFFQMETCFPPWHGRDHDEIRALYAQGAFPDLATVRGAPDGRPLVFAHTIDKCWHGALATAADVLASLKADIRAFLGPEDIALIERHSGIPVASP
ncbi:Protein kinase-like domain protein [Niveomyces insectorum RCEF 264]|uniref:Protein kinase-like domain protein n=1 Tax=Niveomyces insectorum RCEF 264 TaxID=1081102 RepID=A0A162J1Z6_9HYPO|nr:Protein kinase-like domain protein [Niveomyces insectorum RCEF 264]